MAPTTRRAVPFGSGASTNPNSRGVSNDPDGRPASKVKRSTEVVVNHVDLSELVDNKHLFQTSVAREVKEIVWELKNFKALSVMKDSFRNLRIAFEAGKSIGLPTKWIFFIRREDDDIGIYLRLTDNPMKEKEVFARYDTIIRKKNGEEFYRLCTEEVDMNNVADWGWSCLSTLTKLKLPASQVLVDDVLTIHIKFFLFSRQTVDCSNQLSKEKLQTVYQQQLSKSLATMQQNSSFTDVTLQTSDGAEFRAHKVILGAQSTVFDAMFSTNMSEKETGIVKIDDLRGEAFKVILNFIYSGAMDSSWAEYCEEVVYGAEKYNLPLLKSYCDNTLNKACTRENALEMLKLSRLYNLSIASKKITEFIKTNVDGILQQL